MNSALEDFQQFMKQRERAANAYVTGDAEPLGEIVAQRAPATFFGPHGGYQSGAETVAAQYATDAQSFASGGESHFEILHIGASSDIGYWVGFQRASAHMRGNPDPVLFNLRVTEVFRRDGDSWKLIHRHADPLAEPQAPNR